MGPAPPFHTSCAISGLAVCDCPHGQRSDGHSQLHKNAAATLDLWQGQAKLFPPAVPVDVQLPRMHREITVSEADPLPSGLPSVEEAQASLEGCTQAAKEAVVYAARYAAAAGLPYNPGFDVGIDLQQFQRLDPAKVYALETKAQAVRQAILERRSAAQAAAAALAKLPVPSTQPPRAEAVQANGQLFGRQQALQHLDMPASSAQNMPRPRSSSAYEQPAARSRLPTQQWQDSSCLSQQAVPSDRPTSHPAAEERKRKSADSPSMRQPSLQQQQSRGSGAHASSASEASRQPAPKRAKAAQAGPGRRKADGKRRLQAADVRALVSGQWLQLFWPDDGSWWPAQLLSIDLRTSLCTLLYETGEEETDCNLLQLISKGEVAWWEGAGPAPVESTAAFRGALLVNQLQDPPGAVESHASAGRADKRGRSAPRARPSAKPQRPPAAQGGISAAANPTSKAKTPTQYKSDSEHDISSLSEDDDFVAAPRSARRTTTQSASNRAASQVDKPAGKGEAPVGLSGIMAMGQAAVGRQVVVVASPSNRHFNATITRASSGNGDFLVVRYEGGTETELHAEEEGHMFSVQLN